VEAIVFRPLTVALVAASLAFSNGSHAAGEMEQAMRYYEEGKYVLAEKHFRSLASDGNGRAAEILGFMHAIGPELYPGIPRDRRAALQWFDIAARSGRPVGQYMVCALRKQMGAGPVASQCFDWVAETGRPGAR
jgi:TPR repeat protein